MNVWVKIIENVIIISFLKHWNNYHLKVATIKIAAIKMFFKPIATGHTTCTSCNNSYLCNESGV